MTGGLIEVGRCFGMEMSVGKTQVMKISRQPFPVQIVIDQKRLENAEYFNSRNRKITYDTKCKRESKNRIEKKKKRTFNKKNNIFSSQLDLNLRKRLKKCYIWSRFVWC
jgi:hypothetical protein